ncbi:GNAT family N-acetyltransferase [Candidatus Shapirobacteria bacterium]|nr:GNAT family N-acetyltransferase [Candidatus Shapirobacteria bacterium]
MNDLKEKIGRIKVSVVEKLTKEQEEAVKGLQKLAFTEVDDREAEEDFYHPVSIQVLAYIENELVGWAGVHETKQDFEGKKIKLGGYGICTHPSYQRKGIASEVSKNAMESLKKNGVEVAFLSVDPSNTASVKLHEKSGFILLPRMFSWTNVHGELKESDGGMIAPVNSQELFESVFNGSSTLYVGSGYW